MVHYDTVLDTTIAYIKDLWRTEYSAKAYIVQNVYGMISVYIDTPNKTLVDKIAADLKEKIKKWLKQCERIQDNYFAQREFYAWSKNHKEFIDRVWVSEKFLTNEYWNVNQENTNKCNLRSKLISFYSFKGGVGRTTTMVLSAIELAKRGKKVVLIDFDLEAPGVASLFPVDAVSKYGVLDFLLESPIYGDEINIDEYLYTVSEYCRVSQSGGEIYIVPALGQVCQNNADLYKKNLMRFDMNIPAYKENVTPIDHLLMKIDAFLNPDYILIDTRSGLHQIGGMTLARYSDMAMLFFYGSQQNVEGMKMVLPVLKNYQTPFTLINCKVPANENVAAEERNIYIEGSYNAMKLCDEQYENEEILIDDTSADHYPMDVFYSDSLELIGSTEQLMKAYEEQAVNYRQLVTALEDNLEDEPGDEPEEKLSANEKSDNQAEIIKAFSEIMNEMESAAAEDEFLDEDSLIENFYPLKGYTFIFDTRKFLVLGQKGVGKTALFNALKNNNYAKNLARYLKVSSEQYEYTEWIVGTSQDTNWASIFGCLKSEQQEKAFLYYEMIKMLLSSNPSLKDVLDDVAIEMFQDKKDKGLEFYQGFTNETVYILEHILLDINEYLKKNHRIITIIYDALDRVVDQGDRARFCSSLIDIWYRHESTMQNIRSKIFLRQDIYDREVKVADKVKLKNYSVTLTWDYDQLFAMVWKRAIGKSDTVKDFYERIVPQSLLFPEGLSYIPIIDEKGNRNLLAALIGIKMGSSKKASTYNWFRNRLSDTQGGILPRSMVDIFASAAKKESDMRSTAGASLSSLKSIIRPRCFEESLQPVSVKRLIDLKEEYKEYAEFLDNLKNTVQRSPVEEDKLCKALEQANFKNPKDEIINLINIGVLRKYQRRLSDPIRYHFPDIYLRGLGLQRSGMR